MEFDIYLILLQIWTKSRVVRYSIICPLNKNTTTLSMGAMIMSCVLQSAKTNLISLMQKTPIRFIRLDKLPKIQA